MIIISDAVRDDGLFTKGCFADHKSREGYFLLDGNPICNDRVFPEYSRDMWLKTCYEISRQTGCDIVFYSNLEISEFKILQNYHLFDQVYNFIIVSDDDTLEKRLKAAQVGSKGNREDSLVTAHA
ncbi:MAG: hypothetical protein IJ325_12660 [Clostridia bacterium]|nr:hypothetical protein [Clostridia bacterium]